MRRVHSKPFMTGILDAVWRTLLVSSALPNAKERKDVLAIHEDGVKCPSFSRYDKIQSHLTVFSENRFILHFLEDAKAQFLVDL